MTFISGAAQDNLSRPPIIPFRILFYHRLYLLQSAIFTTLSNTSIGGYVAADMTALLSEVQRLMAKGSVTLSASLSTGVTITEVSVLHIALSQRISAEMKTAAAAAADVRGRIKAVP